VDAAHVVPEVAADLAEDQADGADLDDVLQRLVPAAEAEGGEADQRQVRLDQRAADPGVLGRAGLQSGKTLEEVLRERARRLAPAPGLRRCHLPTTFSTVHWRKRS
jgi:hypothetical protein